MKSYTDIVQSKKLAEILPIESADMCYRAYREEGGILDYQVTLCPYQFASWVGIPCWSLTTLLYILEHPLCFQVDNSIHWYCGCFSKDKLYHEVEANNPVDACYKMILKLHEQKLL